MKNNDQPSLESVRFYVDERPLACWDLDLRGRNLEFLNGIDPSYYEYVARLNIDQVDDETHGKHAALALRLAYSQALETFFALVGSLVQAPKCSYGWLLQYRNQELQSVVKKIQNYESLPSVFPRQPTWESIAGHVVQFFDYADEKREWLKDEFARAWRRFATDFLDPRQSEEYNSAKHGLRTRLGGFHLAFGVEKKPGKRADPADMHSLGGSNHGAHFFTLEKMDKVNFRGRRTARNWIPHNHAYGLLLLAMSIQNIVSTLCMHNDQNGATYQFSNPRSEADFSAPWDRHPGISDFNMDYNLTLENIVPFTAEDIAKVFERRSTGEE